MQALISTIESAFSGNESADIDDALTRVYSLLESGELRVAEKSGGRWVTNEWLKKAILLSFRRYPAALYSDGISSYFDRIRPRFQDYTEAQFRALGVRVVPGSVARAGCYIGTNTVLMPSFINVGAYVGHGSMIDTWATVGSCAQVGSNVHISVGVGIGGVLEPTQATPTIIEDNCFVGARSEIVEGVIVEQGSVIGMGVFIGQSTPIYDREADHVRYGNVPPNSMVVAGSMSRGKYALNAAVIVKKVDDKTRSKTSVTELLRGL